MVLPFGVEPCAVHVQAEVEAQFVAGQYIPELLGFRVVKEPALLNATNGPNHGAQHRVRRSLGELGFESQLK